MARRKKLKNSSLLQILAGIVILVVITIIGGNLDSELLDSLQKDLEFDSLENVQGDDNFSSSNNSNVQVNGNLIVDFIGFKAVFVFLLFHIE